MTEQLAHSRFTGLELDAGRLTSTPTVPIFAGADAHERAVDALDEPAAQARYEDLVPGEKVDLTCWTHEFHIVLSRTAEITYSNSPASDEWSTAAVGPGSMFLVPRGWRFRTHAPTAANPT